MGIVEKPKEAETRCARLCRCCPVLTYQQRMLGFVITFALGNPNANPSPSPKP
jgi:hypothetical protein